MEPSLIHKQTVCCADCGSYGKKGNVAANGCGAIAAYNAGQLLSRPFSLQEALLVLGSSALAHGRMGTNPFALVRFLKAKGIRPRRLSLAKTEGGQGAYIVLYLYSQNGRFSGHYTALWGEGGGFLAYNDSHDGQITQYASIREMKKAHNAKALWVWELR